MQILHLLAHRGDGDWTLHYQSGEVGLALLQEAHDNPGAEVIERAIGRLALTSIKGKGKSAIGSSNHDHAAVGSSTIYPGVSDSSDVLQIRLTLPRC